MTSPTNWQDDFSEQNREIPPNLEYFVQRHRTAMSAQLPLPLREA
jgi:hypothetical protein